MKNRILLIDYLHGGHHAVYASILLNGLRSAGHEVIFIGTSELIDQILNIMGPETGITFVFIKTRNYSGWINEINKLLSLKDSLVEIIKHKPNVVHFLQLDRFIFGISLIQLLSNKIQIVSTLHWCNVIFDSNSTLKTFVNSLLFKHLLRNTHVITHSAKTNTIINADPKKNLYYAPYPIHTKRIDRCTALKKKFAMRNVLGLRKSDKLLLCFGGARFDKGSDIAIGALSHLDSSYRLLIAGKEEDFSQADLIKKAKHHGVSDRILFKMAFIEEENLADVFCAADFVLIPYKISFTGQSGPLVYAASIGIPIIGSSAPIISETIGAYQLGEVFMEYNTQALASAIRACPIGFRSPTKFNNDHSPEMFCNSVLKAYNID